VEQKDLEENAEDPSNSESRKEKEDSQENWDYAEEKELVSSDNAESEQEKLAERDLEEDTNYFWEDIPDFSAEELLLEEDTEKSDFTEEEDITRSDFTEKEDISKSESTEKEELLKE